MSTRPPVPGALLALALRADPVRKLQLWTRLDGVDDRQPPKRPQLWIFEQEDSSIRARNFVDLVDIPETPGIWWSRTRPFEFDASGRSLIRANASGGFDEDPLGYPSLKPGKVKLVLTYSWNACAYWHPIDHRLVGAFPTKSCSAGSDAIREIKKKRFVS